MKTFSDLLQIHYLKINQKVRRTIIECHLRRLKLDLFQVSRIFKTGGR